MARDYNLRPQFLSLALQRGLSCMWAAELRALTGVRLSRAVRIAGRPIVVCAPESSISLGERVVLISRSRDTALGVCHPVVLRTMLPGATIAIGDDTGLSGVTICAAHSVAIGARALLGADVIICDTNFHPTDIISRRYEPIPTGSSMDAVRINDDVFIGARSLVLPGVEIGSGSVIGAGSVVSRSIPAGVVAAGNPCHVIRSLSSSTESVDPAAL